MRKINKRKLLKYILIEFIIGIVCAGLFLLFSANYTLIGIIDAFTMSTLLLFAIGWFMFISNEHLLDILFYGVAAFGKAIVGKKMNNSYYDHIQNKEQVSGYIYGSFWITSLVHGVVLLVLFLIYI